MKPPKTITIDAKQYNAAIKQMYGKGRSRDQFDRSFRNGLNEVDVIVQRLSRGYQFISGNWVIPEKKP